MRENHKGKINELETNNNNNWYLYRDIHEFKNGYQRRTNITANGLSPGGSGYNACT